MPDDLTPPAAGAKKIPRAFLEALAAESRFTRAHRSERGGQNDPNANNDNTVLVRNGSGGDLDEFSVLGIDGIEITPTDNEDDFRAGRIVLSGITPSDPVHRGVFVILADPVRAGEIARAYVSGICPAQVNITNATDRFADITNGSALALTSSGANGSALILYKESGAGTGKWAIVQLGVLPIGATDTPIELAGDGPTLRDVGWSRADDAAPVKIKRYRFYCDDDGELQEVTWWETFDSLGFLIEVSEES